mmetsp:Transcript_102301/g.315689  ORF Transcript_102301/g.315689 Transcript_102301/m.315689 type:complete len:84 (-) Transcript_102301:7-258(-)
MALAALGCMGCTEGDESDASDAALGRAVAAARARAAAARPGGARQGHGLGLRCSMAGSRPSHAYPAWAPSGRLHRRRSGAKMA